MEILVSIDDTDNLESCGTGELATNIANHIQAQGWGECRYITRHQLLVHPDIPYTSHNSAMCFEATIDRRALGEIIDFSSQYLAGSSAEGSDPGLCVVVPQVLDWKQTLIEFGARAKKEVLTKGEAYELAAGQGIHLSEHGGTGQGVIGALAGIGLRMGGVDGRLKGQLPFAAGTQADVATLVDHPWVAVVQTEAGEVLDSTERIELVDKIKVVQVQGQPVLLVDRNEQGQWQNLSRKQLKKY